MVLSQLLFITQSSCDKTVTCQGITPSSSLLLLTPLFPLPPCLLPVAYHHQPFCLNTTPEVSILKQFHLCALDGSCVISSGLLPKAVIYGRWFWLQPVLCRNGNASALGTETGPSPIVRPWSYKQRKIISHWT